MQSPRAQTVYSFHFMPWVLYGDYGCHHCLISITKMTPYWLLIIPLMCIGFGIAFSLPAVTFVAMQSVSAERAGLASGALHTGRQL
jgi:DHA2 family methylenomycin A resistance protein-like MFS transporter